MTLEGEEHITFPLRPLSPVSWLRRSDCLLAFQEGGGGLTRRRRRRQLRLLDPIPTANVGRWMDALTHFCPGDAWDGEDTPSL